MHHFPLHTYTPTIACHLPFGKFCWPVLGMPPFYTWRTHTLPDGRGRNPTCWAPYPLPPRSDWCITCHTCPTAAPTFYTGKFWKGRILPPPFPFTPTTTYTLPTHTHTLPFPILEIPDMMMIIFKHIFFFLYINMYVLYIYSLLYISKGVSGVGKPWLFGKTIIIKQDSI